MDILQPQNTRVLAYLARDHRDAPAYAPRTAARDPYYQCDAHPDIVERVWDVIGKALPKDCRGLVSGCPALVHPVSGIVFALATGTRYCLRLPGKLAEEAIRAGAKTQTVWSDGTVLDLRSELGEEWVLGVWLAAEPEWCGQACETFGAPREG